LSEGFAVPELMIVGVVSALGEVISLLELLACSECPFISGLAAPSET